MLAGVSLLYGCFGLLMAATAALVTPIRTDLGLSGAAMGTILGAWQFVYLFTAIPAGSLLDRFGLRPCLLAAALILAASAALRALADDYWTLLFAMMVYGMGGPLISIGAPKLVRRWFDDRSRGLA
ncbi:MAG TPA: MFS transporter, partial [Woeseiaceae bacterium]|nr:MFS transporter [Woeseiaceae bacterium]